MSETYGAMPDYDKPGDLTWNQIDSIAIDQYSKGINMLIPHAVWYDNTKVTYKPELSNRNPLYADSLRYFTRLLSRLNVILQAGGRHVADIALLYPVTSLLSEHYFYEDTGPANVDGPVGPGNEFYRDAVRFIDYIDIANWLTNSAGKDFTFIHPEILDERCKIAGDRLELQNKTNYEEYRVVILPSCRLVPAENLVKLVKFYKSGGKLIFTTRLPSASAEAGKGSEVVRLVSEIFPAGEMDADRILTNAAGGKACFIPHPDARKLREILDKVLDDYDVSYPLLPSLQYIHKVVGGRNIYYFANVGGSYIRTAVTLRGSMEFELWDPHSGSIEKINSETRKGCNHEKNFTDVKIGLKPCHSCFLVEIN